jgi:hypothetical protein
MKLWSTIFVIFLLASTMQGVFAVRESGKDKNSSLLLEAPVKQEFINYKNTFQSRCFS